MTRSGRTRQLRSTEGKGRLRLLAIPLVLVGLAFGASGWFDRSAEETVDLGPVRRLVVVNDAGPIRIRANTDDDPAGVATLVHFDSWLVKRPLVEIDVGSFEGQAAAVARVTCQTRFPCRSSVELAVPNGIEIVVVSTQGVVEVGRFDGSLTVYAAGRGAVLGPLKGTVRVVSDGPVQGFNLRVEKISVSVAAGEVDLSFASPPDELDVVAAAEPVSILVPTNRFQLDVSTTSEEVLLDIRTSERSDRTIVVESEGPVSVLNPSP